MSLYAVLRLSVAFAFFSSFAASAQGLDMAACAKVKNETARLNCFDALASKQVDSSSSTANSNPLTLDDAVGSGKWLVEESVDPLNDEPKFIAALQADEGGAGYQKPTLLVRCTRKSAEVYIDWNEYLSDNTSVTIRFGLGERDTSKWIPSTDESATFLERARNEWFFGSAMQVDRVVAQVTPYRSGPVTAVFDVRGMASAFRESLEICGILGQ